MATGVVNFKIGLDNLVAEKSINGCPCESRGSMSLKIRWGRAQPSPPCLYGFPELAGWLQRDVGSCTRCDPAGLFLCSHYP